MGKSVAQCLQYNLKQIQELEYVQAFL